MIVFFRNRKYPVAYFTEGEDAPKKSKKKKEGESADGEEETSPKPKKKKEGQVQSGLGGKNLFS